MLKLFADNLLPVFLAAGTGYLLAARLRVDARPVAHVAFFVFAPCLVYRLLTESELPGEVMLRMGLFGVAGLLGLAGLAWGLGRFLGWSRRLQIAVVLVVLLPNSGNFGLSACLFAFGEDGLAQATVYFVTASVLTFTIGVLIASLGQAGIRTALAQLPRVPAIWAVLIAFGVIQTGWVPPSPVERTIELLSHATIPSMLVVLGMQLHGRGLVGPVGPLGWAVGLRLAGGAGAGLLLGQVLGLEGVAYQAGVLQSAMPSAVICIVLATEYDVEPAFVTSAVCVSTLLSPLTLTPLLSYLLQT